MVFLLSLMKQNNAGNIIWWTAMINPFRAFSIGFGMDWMERMPAGSLQPIQCFFRIGALAYNVGRLFVLKAQAGRWNRHQVQTLRWKLYETAGKIVFPCSM